MNNRLWGRFVGYFILLVLPLLSQAQVTRFVVSEAGGDDPLGTSVIQSGVPVSIRVTALDEAGAIVTSYARNVTVRLPDDIVTDLAQASVVIPAADFMGNGYAEATITPIHAGTDNRRVTVTDGNVSTYSANADGDADGQPDVFTVEPESFVVGQAGTGWATVYSGSFGSSFLSATIQRLGAYTLAVGPAFNARVAALNSDGSLATGYSGLVTLDSTAFSAPQVVFISDGGVSDDVVLTFANAGAAQTISASATNVTTADASGNFNVVAFSVTGGLDKAEDIAIEDNGRNPGQRLNVEFTVKAQEDVDVDATTDDTFHTIEFFSQVARGQYSISFVSRSAKTTPASSAENGARSAFSFTIPTHFPAGNYTLRISSGGVVSNNTNVDTTITVGGLPDLAIKRFDYVPGTYDAGDALAFDLAWQNVIFSPQNNLPNAAWSNPNGSYRVYRVEIHLSTDEDFGDADDLLVWKATVSGRSVYDDAGNILNTTSLFGGGLNPGQHIAVSSAFKLPENISGTYYLFAKVNSEGGPAGNFSSGLTEQFGPAPQALLVDGNNVVLATETQKLTINAKPASVTNVISSTSTTSAAATADSDAAVVTRGGAYVIFQSAAGFDGGGALVQVYRRNVTTGEIQLVSADSTDAGANGPSRNPVASADGRYIAFESDATNLDPADRNGVSDIYLKDMRYGSVQRLSIRGLVEANSGNFTPSMSYDGRYITFVSKATNLTHAVTGLSSTVSQVYIVDRGSPDANGDFGLSFTISLVSQSAGVAGAAESLAAKISGDGRFVSFVTKARNLHGGAGNPYSQVMRWENGALAPVVVSTASGQLGDGDSHYPAINGDGSRIAFVSRALNLTPLSTDLYENGVPHLYRAELDVAGVVQTILRINGFAGVEPNNPLNTLFSPDLGAFEPSISESGELIAFATESSNLLPPLVVKNLDRTQSLSSSVQNYEDTNSVADVYVVDLKDVLAPVVSRASKSSFGYEATASTVGVGLTTRVPSSRKPAISPDGRYVVFTSDADGHSGLIFGATNFNYGDTNGVRDIYMYDSKVGDILAPTDVPSVTMQMPASISITAGSTITLLATASAPGIGIDRVEYYANNLLIGSVGVPLADLEGGYEDVYGLVWTPPDLGAANPQSRQFVIIAVAVDNNGTRSEISSPSRLTLEARNASAQPVAGFTLHALTDEVRVGSTISLSATVLDADRNFSAVDFYVNGVLVGTSTQQLSTAQVVGTIINPVTERDFSIRWTATQTGTHVVYAVARDASGHKIFALPNIYFLVRPRVNDGVPTVALTTPSGNISARLGEMIRLVADASDSNNNLLRVDFYANGVLKFRDETAPYTGFFYTEDSTETGNFEIYAVAVDADGNQAISNSVIATVTAAVDPVIEAARDNDLFVYEVKLEGDQHIELQPGDPIKYTVGYGRSFPGNGHQIQGWRTEVYLSTDGDPENTENFELGFFDGVYPAEAIGRFEYQVLTHRLPPHFTGTYFLIARIRVTSGAADPNLGNNYPSVFTTATTRVTIRPADAAVVSRVSETTAGIDANEYSESGSVSADGRYVVFQSIATNLVTAPTTATGVMQVYLRDTLTNEITLLSKHNGVAGNASSQYPIISADGRFVVYQSAATNLISGAGNLDTNGRTDVFLYELSTGLTSRISVPSGAAAGAQANQGSFLPAISDNGDYIVFESDATNLLPTTAAIQDTNGQRDIYLVNRATRVVTAVSTSATGIFGSGSSTQVAISGDGSTIVFRSFARNLGASVLPVGYTRSVIYAKDRASGAVTPISVLREAIGAGATSYTAIDSDAFDPAVSQTGQYIAFASRSSKIPAYPGSADRNTNGTSQVYVVNRQYDPTAARDVAGNVSLSLVSASLHPVTGQLSFGDDESLAPVISGDGRYVGYRSEASDLLPVTVTRSDGLIFPTDQILYYADYNQTSDVYLRDTGIAGYDIITAGSGYNEGDVLPLTVATGGGSGATAIAIVEGGVISRVDVITGGAGYIFQPADLVVSGGGVNAVIRPRLTATSDRVSVSHFGRETIGLIGSHLVPSSRDLAMSRDGRYLVFTSDAANTAGFIFGRTNQAPLDDNEKRDVFMVDRRIAAIPDVIKGEVPEVTVTLGLPSSGILTAGSSMLVQVSAFDLSDVDETTFQELEGSVASIALFANGVSLPFTQAPVLGESLVEATAIYTANLTPGQVVIYAVAVDANGNRVFSASQTVTVTAATSVIRPSVSVASPIGTTVQANQTALLTAQASSATGSAISSVGFYVNGLLRETDTSSPYTFNFAEAIPATYVVVALVTNNHGNTSVSAPLSMTVTQPVPPTVALIRPAAAGATGIVNQRVLLEAEVTSLASVSSIKAVELFADGESIGVAQRVAVSNRYVLSTWQPTLAKTYSITAQVTDSFDQVVTSAARPIVVSVQTGVVPTVVITSPAGSGDDTTAGAGVSNNSSLYLAALANDADGSVTALDYLLTRGTQASASISIDTEIEDGTILRTYTLTLLSGGTGYLYEPTVKLVGGNGVGMGIEITGFANGQVTELQFTSLGSGYTIAPQVVFEGGGLYEDLLIGAATQTAGTLNWTYALDLRNYDVGPYTLRARVTDNDENTAISSPVAINVVAATAGSPSLSINSVAPSSVRLGQAANIFAVATAATGTSITQVDFFANGAPIGSVATAPYTLVFTPPSAGNYTITASVTDSAGNRVIAAQSRTLTVTVYDSAALLVINSAYQKVLGRSPTDAEIQAAIAKFQNDVTLAELSASLIDSASFRDADAELLLTYLAVWGEYPPTLEQFEALRQQAAGTGDDGETTGNGTTDGETTVDATLVDSLLNSSAYVNKYGVMTDLTTTSTSQYAFIRAFAIRTYRNVHGVAPNKTQANIVAQQFFNNIVTLGLTPGQAIITYVNASLNGGKTGTLWTNLRLAGTILLVGGEQPTATNMALFKSVPISLVADYYLEKENRDPSAGTVVTDLFGAASRPAVPAGTTYHASGLPAGLKINATTGVISGRLPGTVRTYTITTWTQLNGVRSANTQRVIVVNALDTDLVGNFQVLLEDSVGLPAGRVQISVAKSAAYTGTLFYRDGKNYALKGVLSVNASTGDAEGTAQIIARKNLASLVFELDLTAAGDVSAAVTEGTDTFSGTGIKNYLFTAKAPAPWRGSGKGVYNITLDDVSTTPVFTDAVLKAGKGTLTVAVNGTVALRLRGSDRTTATVDNGTLITGSYVASLGSEYLVYTRPYTGTRATGYFAGWMQFSDIDTPALVDLAPSANELYWLRPAGGTGVWAPGFGPLSITPELVTTP